MIAIWIIGVSFLVVGLSFCIPRYVKFAKCKGRTTGVITHSESGHGTGSQPIKAYYEYAVNGINYRKTTGWTSNGIFVTGKTCEVKYNLNNPDQSYIKKSGQIMNCIVGTIFAVVGVGALGLGIILVNIL